VKGVTIEVSLSKMVFSVSNYYIYILCIGTDQEERSTWKPNSQAYQCLQCHKTLYLTSTEILRHKKQHQWWQESYFLQVSVVFIRYANLCSCLSWCK